MRLFIAIQFDPSTKQKLLAIQRKLSACASGNFTRPENLHLTVLFLGEARESALVQSSIGARFTEPVTLTFDKVGTFRRDLYWVGIRPNSALTELYFRLRDDLRHAGFEGDWDDRVSPHITLAREVRLAGQPDLCFEPFSMTAKRLSLMKSERIGGRLAYTEVFGKDA